MNNHFGKGLMAGLKATHADSAVNVTKFCADYKRGFVLGYSHRMYEKTGDRQLSAWEAGILTRWPYESSKVLPSGSAKNT